MVVKFSDSLTPHVTTFIRRCCEHLGSSHAIDNVLKTFRYSKDIDNPDLRQKVNNNQN
jgi:hypothetical protein